MKEWLLLDGIALHSTDITPGNIERPATVEPNLADSGLSIGNRTAVPARIAAHAIAIELFD
jgi:hypothetical protein